MKNVAPRLIKDQEYILISPSAVLRHLQYRIGITLGEEKLSVHEILEELLGVQASIYTHKETMLFQLGLFMKSPSKK